MFQVLEKEIDGILYKRIESDYQILVQAQFSDLDGGYIEVVTPWMAKDRWPYLCTCLAKLEGDWHNGSTICHSCPKGWDADWGADTFLNKFENSESGFLKFIKENEWLHPLGVRKAPCKKED